MKKKTNLQYARALYELTKDAPEEDLPHIAKVFVSMLASQGRLRGADAIIETFADIVSKQEGIQKVHITTAQKMDDPIIEAIKKVIGDKVEATQSVDKTLQGGFILQTEDTIFDASIRATVEKMRGALIHL